MIAIPLHLMAMSIAQFECWNMQLQRYHYDDYGSFFLRTLRLCLTLCNKITKNLANIIYFRYSNESGKQLVVVLNTLIQEHYDIKPK